MKVAVITPCFNNFKFTEQLFNVMLEFTPPDWLVVVDNGSKDATPSYLEALDSGKVSVITNSENVGFGRAVNQGIERALELGCDTLVCLNNDVRILGLDWLYEIKVALQENPKRLVGRELIVNNGWTELIDGECIPYLGGWVLGFTRQFVQDVGVFDPRFFAYFDDVDIAKRAKDAGYALHAIPSLGLYHFGGITGRLISFEAVCRESRRKYAEKWGVEFMDKD